MTPLLWVFVGMVFGAIGTLFLVALGTAAKAGDELVYLDRIRFLEDERRALQARLSEFEEEMLWTAARA